MNHRETFKGPLWMAVLEKRKKGDGMYLCILDIFCSLLIKIYSRWVPSHPPYNSGLCHLATLAVVWGSIYYTLWCGSSFKSTSGRRTQNFWVALAGLWQKHQFTESRSPWLRTAAMAKQEDQALRNRWVQENLRKKSKSYVLYIQTKQSF